MCVPRVGSKTCCRRWRESDPKPRRASCTLIAYHGHAHHGCGPSIESHIHRMRRCPSYSQRARAGRARTRARLQRGGLRVQASRGCPRAHEPPRSCPTRIRPGPGDPRREVGRHRAVSGCSVHGPPNRRQVIHVGIRGGTLYHRCIYVCIEKCTYDCTLQIHIYICI